MSQEVTFEGEDTANLVGNISIVQSRPKGMLAWLVANKVVKNAKQGEGFMLGVAVVAIVLAIVIYFYSFMGGTFVKSHATMLPGPNGTLVPAPNQ